MAGATLDCSPLFQRERLAWTGTDDENDRVAVARFSSSRLSLACAPWPGQKISFGAGVARGPKGGFPAATVSSGAGAHGGSVGLGKRNRRSALDSGKE